MTPALDTAPRDGRRRALVASVEAIYADGLTEPERRIRMVTLLKGALKAGRAPILARFAAGEATGTATVRALAQHMDAITRTLYDAAQQHEYVEFNPTAGDRLCVVAVGGYGRAELAPSSDVDLLFLRPYKPTPHGEQVTEYMLYMLWDLGLKVGHAMRSVDDCVRLARTDITIKTSLLESRFVCGDQALFTELRAAFVKQVMKGSGLAFVEAKLAERDARHKRLGDSRYVLEPNIKEGKGGLRDLQTLYWIGKYLYRVDGVSDLVERGVLSERELRRFNKAQNLLWSIRCHLHMLAGRAEERLTFDYQARIAARLGYGDRKGSSGVERFMKHYYIIAKDVGDLTRIFCAAIEAEHKRRAGTGWRWPRRARRIEGFRIDGQRLNVTDDGLFARDPAAMLRLFHASHTHAIQVHPHALRLATQNLKRIDQAVQADPEANRLFMEILTSERDPEITLRHMNEAGIFGRFVPDFGRIVGQMQHDLYHVFTVDEHTLRAIGILHRIEEGRHGEEHPVATRVIKEIHSRRALYVGLLLHDIAKGRGGDHSKIGARIARRLGPRLGLSEEETETAAWLVEDHLAMSATAFKRDLSEPKTIADFVARVQSPERLRLLLCLTVADIRAVGPRIWNNWKAALLRELFEAAADHMAGGHLARNRDERVAHAQAALRARLADWPDADIEAHFARGYPPYWLAFPVETLARHARLVREAEATDRPLSVATRVDARNGVTEVTVYTHDHPGLFWRIAGAFSACGANVVDARIFTTPQGMALDHFWVQDEAGAAFERPDRLARMAVMIERALDGRLTPADVAGPVHFQPARTRVFTVPPRVLIDNHASPTHTVIEVNGRDRPGFLHAVTGALYDVSLQISSAKIATYGERAVDVFYVKDGFGMKITHETRLARIRQHVLHVIAKADPAGGGGKTPLPEQEDETAGVGAVGRSGQP